jgi:hypothetical protein
MRRGTNPVFIHVAADGLILAPDKRNREQSAVLDLDPTTRTLAVNLGADYCAEHEWGIKKLYEAFGVKSELKNYGLKRRKISKVPKSLVWVKLIDGRQGFAYRNFWFRPAEESLVGDSDLKSYDVFDREKRKMKPNPVQLCCAWSDDDFACVSKDLTDIKYLREIFDQFKKKNIIFTFSNALPAFENPGLIIAIADRMPNEVVEILTKADREAYEVEQFVVKTKIRELLEKNKKGYFALSAKRWEDGGVRFWLNPMEQDKNRAMWCTLDDLKQWAEGKGPIPFTPAEVIKRHEERYGKKAMAIQ